MLFMHSITEMIRQVNGALKNCQSGLALARSPLANSPLVHPLLVLDDVSPTADERGHALWLVLQWAVARLAPEPTEYPLGTPRPYDDPTWRDPRWWRYNILRHRYLEPLHPDEFIEGGRFTETLLALTGITSADAFFAERNRAIREVAQRLQAQLSGGEANVELQALALEEVLRPLQRNPEHAALLGIAATFDDVFPRSLLLQMAAAEHLDQAERALNELTAKRYLLMGDGGVNLWLSPLLQKSVYARQSMLQLHNRHLAAASYFQQQDEMLKASEHYSQGGEWTQAANLLLAAVDELTDDLHVDELLAILADFKADQIPPTLWCAVQLVRSDLCQRQGEQATALTICRQALSVAKDATQRGQLYWRMGKLYEKRNQIQALEYYARAATELTPRDPTLVELLKDRAWLHILRREWQAAEEHLQRALTLHPALANEQRADLLDALAHLHLEQQHFASAIDYAQESLQLREAAGDLLQIAKSLNNLGNFYNQMGEVDAAIAAHNEALQLYQKLNNQALEAEAWLNQGVVYHTAGRQREAIEKYHKSLLLSQRMELLLTEVTAHCNLVEAYAEIGERAAAEQHWRFGHALSSRANFRDELLYLQELYQRFAFAAEPPLSTAVQPQVPTTIALPRALLAPDEQAVLALATTQGQVTPRVLMAQLHISKATATRRLAALTQSGLLIKRGRGRGTCYLPAPVAEGAPTRSVEPTVELTVEPVVEPVVERVGEPLPRATGQQRAQQTTDAAVLSLRALLEPHLHRLRDDYQVTEVVLLRTEIAGAQIYQLGVAFQQPPTVVNFFKLEEMLATWCGHRIVLLPLAFCETEIVAARSQLVLAATTGQ